MVTRKGKKWIYKNRDAVLKVGDTIFYWIYVIRNGKGYMNTDLEYRVTGKFFNLDKLNVLFLLLIC